MPTSRTVTAARAAVLLVLLCGGCLGYRLGSTLPPDVRSVHVPTVVNKCGEPLLETEVTRAIVRELHKDGTLRVTSADAADSVLQVTLTDYTLRALRFEKDRIKSAKEYRLKIEARVIFSRTATDKELMNKRVEGEADFPTGGDLTSAKRAALPEAARDLAHDIVESVVEYW